MNSGLNPANPIIVAAFRSALFQQWAIVAAIFALLLLCWGATRGWVTARTNAQPVLPARWHEPKARRLLRVGFGVLWLFDGILQAQPQMAGGLPSQVIQPAGADSPAWVQHLVNWGGSVWSNHPIQAGAASVWIQVGIGMWLIFAVSGWPSRLAGMASAAWGLIVWVFAEAFGEIFAPGQTVLFGAPGAVIFYVAAGVLIALPERVWRTALTGRLLLGGMGVFFAGMALLQAWPGRGFWQGTLHGRPGPLADMVKSMAGIQQPHALSVIVSWFGNFTAAHGFAVNLLAVITLAALGALFCLGAVRADARLAGIGVLAGGVCCLADWVLIEDFGFFGGLGTDPNSMIPLILLFVAGYQALTPAPHPVPAMQPVTVVSAEATEVAGAAGAAGGGSGAAGGGSGAARGGSGAAGDGSGGAGDGSGGAGGGSGGAGGARGGGWGGRLGALRDSVAALSGRSVAALGAVGVIVVGAAPMAFASVNKDADPIIARALAGSSGPLDTPAPDFTLTSQAGREVSLASLRGKVVLLTFLDPVCTTDCPLIAQEMRAADARLGTRAANVELVAVVANPTYVSTAFTTAFTRQENLDQVPNWLYLTGPLSRLRAVWEHYGIEVENLPAGAMSAHNDVAYVISATGRIRQAISDDPGPGTSTTLSSFAGLLADSVLQTMGQGR